MSNKFVIASKYNKGISSVYSEEERAKATELVARLKKFSAILCRKFKEAALNSALEDKPYFYLIVLDDDSAEYAELLELLDNKWRSIVSKYFDSKDCVTVKDRVKQYINSKRYNSGIDPVTNQPYRVSVFTKKGPMSKFKNGVIVSRDGIEYK